VRIQVTSPYRVLRKLGAFGPKVRKAFIEGGRQVGAVDEEAGGVRIVVGSKCWPGG
jgi:hypothetical protein